MQTPTGDRHEHCHGVCVSADELVSIFYDQPEALGAFVQVDRRVVPSIYRALLDHTNHMTVTVESHHGQLVDVQVLQSNFDGDHYRREILLRTQGPKTVVQYGIVRLNTKFLSEKPRNEILAQRKPLGRVLIEHNVLREIELFDLLRVECGPRLAEWFEVPQGTVTYGRTALLYCDDEPAIELLEIVRPEPE
jgi:chorismate-pyruvate lyase